MFSVCSFHSSSRVGPASRPRRPRTIPRSRSGSTTTDASSVATAPRCMCAPRTTATWSCFTPMPKGTSAYSFPLDPTDDNFVRGGKKYEVEGRGGRDAFDVGDRSGRGTVYAAVSGTPFRFDEFTLSGHWDYKALEPRQLAEDPEPELTELVRRMAQGSFDYDVMSYYVVDRVVYANDYSYSRPYYSGLLLRRLRLRLLSELRQRAVGEPVLRAAVLPAALLLARSTTRTTRTTTRSSTTRITTGRTTIARCTTIPGTIGARRTTTALQNVDAALHSLPVPGSHRDERRLSRPALHLRAGGEHGVHPADLPARRARECLADAARGGAAMWSSVPRRRSRGGARRPSPAATG